MNIVCSWASSRWSTSIFTAIPLYARTAVAMLADTVGAETAAPRFSRSTIHLSVPEQEEVAVARVADVERRSRRFGRRAEKERVAAVGARPRSDHLDPERAAGAAPGVRNAHRRDAAGAGLQLDRTAVEVEHRLPLEDVEALLVRMEVRVEVPVRERAQREPHVRRTGRAVDEPAGLEAAGLVRIRIGEGDVLAADEAMTRPPVRERARSGVAGHRGCQLSRVLNDRHCPRSLLGRVVVPAEHHPDRGHDVVAVVVQPVRDARVERDRVARRRARGPRSRP